MKIYQYAVMYLPSEEEQKNNGRAKIIVEPKTCLAPDDSTATLLAGRDIPQEYLDRLDRVKVAVRPF